MDNAISNALKRKRELENELAEVSEFLRLHKRFANAESVGVKRKKRVSVRVSTKFSGRPAELVAIMENILRRHGQPMTRSELARSVEDLGHEIPSDDKPRYLGTVLWRHSKKFENLEKRGYWLKGVKVPSDPQERMDLAIGVPSAGSNRT